MATVTQEARAHLLDGPPYRTIVRLATPTVIAMLAQSVVNEIDVVFFSRLPFPESSNAQAALAPSLILVWLFGGTLSAISVGTQALTARRVAERAPADAGRVLLNAMWFSLWAGLAFTLLAEASLTSVLRLVKVPEAALPIAVSYSRYRMLGIVSMAMTQAVKSFFDGIGKTYVHLVASVVMNIVNVSLCWLLIFGNAGAPRMGAPGAGLAALASTWVGLAIVLGWAWTERERFTIFSRGGLSRAVTWDVLKLSIPAGLATTLMMVGFSMFLAVAGKLDGLAGGDEAVNGAATTVVIAVLKLTFTACIAFGTSTATLVSQALGAKRPEDGEKFGWASVRLGLAIFGVIGLLEGLLFTRPIVAFLSHSPRVLELAVGPMRMMGLLTPVVAVAMILSEALFGAGAPRFVAVAQFVLVFFVLVPTSWVLALLLHQGLMGMWTAAALYCVLAALVMTAKFRGGAWKTIAI